MTGVQTCALPILRGSLQCPMSDAELEAKFGDQVALAAPGIDVQRAIDLLWQMESLPNVAPLIAVLTIGAVVRGPQSGATGAKNGPEHPKNTRGSRIGARQNKTALIWINRPQRPFI